MQYPSHLLPTPAYQIIVFSDWLHSFYLVRHTPDGELVDADTGKLKMSYIVLQSDHLRDFSTNLLGIFMLGDVGWHIREGSERRNYFNASWKEGEAVDLPLYPHDCDFDASRGYFSLLIKDIEGQSIFYQIGNDLSGSVFCRVMHTPTRCNFWHFSIRWFNEAGDDVGLQKGEWVKRLLRTQVRTLIQQKARLDTPIYNSVDASYYRKVNE